MSSPNPVWGIVRHRRDRVNVVRSLVAPLIFFWPFLFGLSSWIAVALYGLVLLVVLVDLNYVLHIHAHRAFTSNRAANLVLDLCLGSVTGMTSSNWRIQHVYGHHCGKDAAYTIRSLDWTLRRYSFVGALLFSFGNSLPTFWGPIVESYRKGVLENLKEPIDYRHAFLEQVAFVLFVVVLAVIDPVLTFAFVLPWYVLVFAMTRYVDYLNHYGCGNGTFDCANNSLNRSFNRRIHNFGYHTAHHLRPGAHWTELPTIHKRIEGQIPPNYLKPFSWSSALLPNHFARSRRGQM